MKKTLAVLVCSIVCWSWSASAQSLDKAKLLYANKLYEDAKKELVAIAVSAAAEEDRAAALDLLGTIAIDEGNYEAAIANWTQLIERYPASAEARAAGGKLPLAKKLAASVPSEGASPVAERVPPETVFIAGSCPEAPEYADQAVLELMNFLTSSGVRVQNAFTGRLSDATWGRSEMVSLPNVLQHAQLVGASGVLFVFLHVTGAESMRVESYGADGRKLWEEKVVVSGGVTKAGLTQSYVRRISKKLAPRVGGPGLPRSGPGVPAG